MGKKEVKERYEYLKSRGICIACGKRKAVHNRVRCSYCLYKANERAIEYRNKNIYSYREKEKERMKELYKKREQEGRCRCGRKPIKGKKYCVECRIKARRRYENKRKDDKIKREDFAYFNLCRICGSENLVEGKKLCLRCYNNALKGLKKALSNQDLSKHIWKIGG